MLICFKVKDIKIYKLLPTFTQTNRNLTIFVQLYVDYSASCGANQWFQDKEFQVRFFCSSGFRPIPIISIFNEIFDKSDTSQKWA